MSIKNSKTQPWWNKVTQLRDIKDPTVLENQIAKQQCIYVLREAIQNSLFPDVIARLIITFIIDNKMIANATNKTLLFNIRTMRLYPFKKHHSTYYSYSIAKSNLWKANYKYCLGIEFKLKNDITIAGIDCGLFFGGVQCYAVLSEYKKDKKTKTINNKSVYKNTFLFKLIPSNCRQHVDIDIDTYYRSSQLIFTEINSLNNGGLRLLAKNTMYKLGFIISDGFYCNDSINLKLVNKSYTVNKNIKYINYRLLNKSRLLGRQDTYFGKDLIDQNDNTSRRLKWFPKIQFITF